MDVWNLAAAPLEYWLLFALRALAFLASSPVFSARFIPLQFRLYLAFLLSVLAFTAWQPQHGPLVELPMGTFVMAAVNELLMGLALGTIISLLLLAFQFAGTLAGYQMGLSIVNVLDPQSQQQVSLIGDFFFVTATLGFLELNLHLDILRLWQRSFELAPPGGFTLGAGQGELNLVLELAGGLLKLGLQIAMPLLLFLILLDAALGILARVVPQMNVFIMGSTLKTAFGLIILAMLILQFGALLERRSSRYIDDAEYLLRQSRQHKLDAKKEPGAPHQASAAQD